MSEDRQPSIKELLADPFTADEIGWLPKVVKGNQALAIGFLNARAIQDRLDEVMGLENWQDDYEVMDGGSVMCRLKLRINGEWVMKMDVGSPSEQPDAGDKLKAAVSDSLKRAAVKWGIGRFLYRIKPQWCPYDPTSRQFTQRPQLPAWARPKAITHEAKPPAGNALPPPQQQHQANNTPAKQGRAKPQTGKEMCERIEVVEAEMVKRGLCRMHEIFDHLRAASVQAGFPNNLYELNAQGIDFCIEAFKSFVNDREQKAKSRANAPQQQKAAPSPQTGNPRPNGTTATLREAMMATIRVNANKLQAKFKEDVNGWLSRNGYVRWTLQDIADDQSWGVKELNDVNKKLEEYLKQDVPY